ncbi:phage tail assembly protein [Variovorax ureilyticus]|uniref:phage tail assembly protein n=1 Tax=Variovorax ureilyticus TaxID=1836198 RepID=UPI003D676276
MDETEKTITLRKPVKLADIEYTSLTLREPTAGEIEKAANATTNVGVVINLISLVAKVPRKAIENLCKRDLQEAGDFWKASGWTSSRVAGPTR